ncbi:hypothetical protein [Tenacibaculum sp. 190524A05c]|uniref:hypothetical protein n=1 Tax=Tenacibaculum platacis TaxID=3137852 RepID=UPI0032B1F4DB
MKKFYAKMILVLLTLTIVNCTEEKEVIDNNQIDVDSFVNIVTELPENAIHADKVLSDHGYETKSKSNKIDTQSGLGGDLQEIIYYKRFFVVYPYDWNETQKLNYLNSVRTHTGKDIYTVLDICKFVDTWYVEISKNTPPFGIEDKKKNVIVASTTNVDPQETNVGADEGPGEVSGSNNNGLRYYTHCSQVPLPPLYTEDDSNNGPSGPGPGSGDGINEPQQ